MVNRLDLDEKLRAFLGSDNVYFQPPESVKLKYPCIVYERYLADSKYADNSTYTFTFSYQVTIIDKDPDSELVKRFPFEFKKCKWNRHYTSDNLNHDVFVVFN